MLLKSLVHNIKSCYSYSQSLINIVSPASANKHFDQSISCREYTKYKYTNVVLSHIVKIQTY